MKSELNVLEGVLERSGDQAKEELRTLKQMFEQSEQSRNTCKLFAHLNLCSVLVSLHCVFFAVTAEMVRLSTENDYLKQEREKLDVTGTKMSQKAASLVRCVLFDSVEMRERERESSLYVLV